MAKFVIPQTVPKFAGAPLAALDPDDLRYILRQTRRGPRPSNGSCCGAMCGRKASAGLHVMALGDGGAGSVAAARAGRLSPRIGRSSAPA